MQTNAIFRYLESVDPVTRTFELRLLLEPAMCEDIGFASFGEALRVWEGRAEAGGENGGDGDDNGEPSGVRSSGSDCGGEMDAEPLVVTVQFTLDSSAGKIVEELYNRASQLLLKAGKTG